LRALSFRTIGVGNALIVVVGKIDSFIATLATGSLLLAGMTVVSGNQQIVGPRLNSGLFYDIANTRLGGISITAVYLIVAAAIIWYVLERTVAGRWIYATGFNADAARLAGVPTRALRFLALISSALTAGGFTGIIVTSQIGAGDTTVGPPYLLSAFGAAFLGATQLKHGRSNAWAPWSPCCFSLPGRPACRWPRPRAGRRPCSPAWC
jgi:ribose transport system permease protein